MLQGARSLLVGYHSLLTHTIFVTLSWKKIYKGYPNSREFICILLHDIGYIFQENVIRSKEDKHPELGAKICGYLFGDKYYQLCIGHSRDYASNIGIELTKLGYADKYCVLLMPTKIQRIISILDYGKTIDIYQIKETYLKWWNENGQNA
jgi:hypothetical protein